MTAAPSPQADLVGAILSRKYTLKRLIGAGGMGSVYEAHALPPEIAEGKLAIKVLAIDYVTDVDIKNRFVDEGMMCQRLIHPNIVRVFDVDMTNDPPFLVMEYVDGLSLQAAVARAGDRKSVV